MYITTLAGKKCDDIADTKHTYYSGEEKMEKKYYTEIHIKGIILHLLILEICMCCLDIALNVIRLSVGV